MTHGARHEERPTSAARRRTSPPHRARGVVRARLGAALAAALTILCCVPAFADDATKPAPEVTLPPGVVARVYGKDILESDLYERLLKRWGQTDRGKEVLEQLVDDTCVEMEAKKRGILVTDEEVAAYVRRVDETIRKQTGGSRTIDDIYKDQHATPAEFAASVHEYLKRQKMATEDLGAKPGEEVPEARLKLWLSSVRRRSGVRYTDLPDGAFAAIGGTVIDRVRYARALEAQLPAEVTTAARADLVVQAATEHALADAKIVVTDAEVDADIAKLRERFAKDPRVRNTGLTFDEFLKQNQGTSEAELRVDPRYRASIGLERYLGRNITEADIKKQWDDNRDAYGERALVRQIYVAGQDEGGQFKMRTFQEAKELVLRAKVAVLEASGGLTATPQAGRKSLPDAFGAVAKQFEEDPKKKQGAGEPAAWTRVNLAGEDALASAVFEGQVGTLQGPVRSRVGYHLVFVEERRPAPSFDEVKDSVREDLVRRESSLFQMTIKADPNIILAAK